MFRAPLWRLGLTPDATGNCVGPLHAGKGEKRGKQVTTLKQSADYTRRCSLFLWPSPLAMAELGEATLSRQPTAPGILSRSGTASSFGSEGKLEPGASAHLAAPEPEPELDLMGRLDADSVLSIANFVGTQGVLQLCAVCHEWARVYQQAILRLRLSLVPLAGTPLSRVLRPLLRRMPALTAIDLSGSGACDGDVQIIGDAVGP